MYVRQCVGIKFAKIIYEKCSQLKKKSHNHLKSPGTIISATTVDTSNRSEYFKQMKIFIKHFLQR
jgi:hypothetical protein